MSAGRESAAWRVPGLHIEWGPAQAQAPLPSPPFHDIALPDGSPWCEQHRVAAGYLLRFHDLADFSVARNGDRITCHGVPGTDDTTLQHLLQNQVLPLALSRQGRMVLHASAVVVEGRALAFVGVSGRGKSTLAAAFAAQGCPFLTDDGLQLQQVQGQVQVVPGPASLRLWEDARTALAASPQSRASAAAATPKMRLVSNARLPHATAACPLAALYFLGDSAVDAISIVPLGGQDVLFGLLQHCFLLDIEARDLLQNAFAQFSDMVRRIPAFRLDYPRRFEDLPTLLTTLREHAAAVSGSV